MSALTTVQDAIAADQTLREAAVASRAPASPPGRLALSRFEEHPGRAAALGEIHARPSAPVVAGQSLLCLAFGAEGGASPSLAAFADLCRKRGEAVPGADARHHAIAWADGRLAWERHSEFTTFTWIGPAPTSLREPLPRLPFGDGFQAPGMLLAATRIDVRSMPRDVAPHLSAFEESALCVSRLEEGRVLLATDFHPDGDGRTGFLMLATETAPVRLGQIAKAAAELDIYRTLAMLGLPVAQRLSQRLSRIEAELVRLTAAMGEASGTLAADLLEELTGLAAGLEADAAASLYRFGATRAYGEIVRERMELIGPVAPQGRVSIPGFIERRLGPALRTCLSAESRLAGLSERLARAANLLRTRVDVDIEQQNRALLDQMNRRAAAQLRLQQTVEGLSVAAISYYVVGLFLTVATAMEHWLPDGLSAKAAAGLFAPLAVFGVWFTVRRIRLRHDRP